MTTAHDRRDTEAEECVQPARCEGVRVVGLMASPPIHSAPLLRVFDVRALGESLARKRQSPSERSC